MVGGCIQFPFHRWVIQLFLRPVLSVALDLDQWFSSCARIARGPVRAVPPPPTPPHPSGVPDAVGLGTTWTEHFVWSRSSAAVTGR